MPGEVAGTRRPARIAILGAAGRDFHNFNLVFRDDPDCQVVAFTAAQIPGIDARSYPASLAGPRYPEGIPILPESALETLVRDRGAERIVFSYSDVTHAEVMHLASRAIAAGADFLLLGPQRTMLHARIPVIAVSAVRTGCGKSQTSRYLARRDARRGGAHRRSAPVGGARDCGGVRALPAHRGGVARHRLFTRADRGAADHHRALGCGGGGCRHADQPRRAVARLQTRGARALRIRGTGFTGASRRDRKISRARGKAWRVKIVVALVRATGASRPS